MHTGTKTFIFGDLSCSLMKLKLNCLTVMTTVTFGGKSGKLTSLRTPSQLWSTGVAASCCGRVWCTSQNRWHHEEATSQWPQAYGQISYKVALGQQSQCYVVAIMMPRSQSYWKLEDRAEKVCMSRAASNQSSTSSVRRNGPKFQQTIMRKVT